MHGKIVIINSFGIYIIIYQKSVIVLLRLLPFFKRSTSPFGSIFRSSFFFTDNKNKLYLQRTFRSSKSPLCK